MKIPVVFFIAHNVKRHVRAITFYESFRIKEKKCFSVSGTCSNEIVI